MKKIITIEKVSNGYIAELDGEKNVYEGELTGLMGKVFAFMSYEDEGYPHTLVIEVDPVIIEEHQVEDH